MNKQCPFCASEDVELNSTKPGTKTRPKIYWVTCHKCGATGPDKKSSDAATVAWNARPTYNTREVVSGHANKIYEKYINLSDL